MIYPHYLDVKSTESEISASPVGGASIRTPLPREHGAWGLLLQPFIAGMILAGEWTWFYFPALGLAVFGFMMREPLLVYFRQRFLWRRVTQETKLAGQWTAGMMAGAGVCAGILTLVFPIPILMALLGIGAAITITSVWLSLRNLQRSMTLQMVSAIGLTATGWLALVAAGKQHQSQGWILWALLAAHAVAVIPVVHARLQMKVRKASVQKTIAIAVGVQMPALIIATGLLWNSSTIWVPLGFSFVANSWELLRLWLPQELSAPLKRIGLRLLSVSVLHTLVVLAVLNSR